MTRRQMLQLPLAALGAPVLYAQRQHRGMASSGVKPQPRGHPSGLPLDAHFVNVAQAAGLRAPVIFGDVDHNDYHLENMGCGAAFLDYDNDDWLDVILLTAACRDSTFPACKHRVPVIEGHEPAERRKSRKR
jgi:hypothetical protein